MLKSLFRKKATYSICAQRVQGHWVGDVYHYKILYISVHWMDVLKLLEEKDLILLGYKIFNDDTEVIIQVSGYQKDLEAFVSEFARRAGGAYTITRI